MESCNVQIVQYNGEDLKKFSFPSNFDHTLSAVPGNPCYNFRFRIFVFFSYIVITQVAQLFGTPTQAGETPLDSGHRVTKQINTLIHQEKWFATLLQTLSSIILDFSFFFVSIYWVLYCRTFRLFAALILFYVVRSLHLNMLQMPFTEGYYWEDPGLPSLVVKYGQFCDFFYSGHVGFLAICALEMRRVGKRYVAIALFICSIYQAFVVIVFQIHYTIDVTGGYIYAHYFYNLICDWEVKIDYYLKRVQDLFTWTTTKKNIRIEEADIEKPQMQTSA